MKILGISYLDIWPYGKDKGIPSIYISQKALVERGHEVYFLSLAREDAPGDKDLDGIHLRRFRLPFYIAKLLSGKPIRTDTFFGRLKATLLFNLAWLFFQILSFCHGASICRRLRPDVIYSHDLTPAFPAWLLSRIFKTKLVFRLYGTRNLYWGYQYFWWRLKEFRDFAALRLPADIFIITKDGTRAQELLDEIGVKDDKIRMWRNGVDFSTYDPDPENRIRVRRKLGIAEDKKIIISTSRLIPFYHMERFIFRLPEIFRLQENSVALIAADGPLMDKFQEFVKAQGVQDRVVFTGMVKRQEVKDYLNASDMYVSFSSFSNCNNSLFEAMISGLAIVALENLAIMELIDSGENGYLVRDYELDYLPGAIARILSDEALLKKFQDNVRKAASEKLWTWAQRMDEEDRLLRALV